MPPSPSTTSPEVDTEMSAEHDNPPEPPAAMTTPEAATTPVGTEAPTTGTEATATPAGPETSTTTPEAVTMVAADSGVKSAIWAKFTENPLPSVLGGVIVVMLSFVLTTTNARISDTNDRIDDTNDRITSLEVKMDNRINGLEVKMDNRINGLEEKVDDINLKLTALIAALNKTSEVDAALSGAVSFSDP